MNLRQIISIFAILAFVSTNAKIATWSISPSYQELKRYNGELYLYQNNGKWGIIKASDIIVIPANYDFITSFVNGYALIGTKEGSKYRLDAIISEDGKTTHLKDRLYLPGSYQYFSEGKLAVSNSSGKFGYINSSGNIVVRCQFNNAYPFKDGYAPVQQGNYMKFINENYDNKGTRKILLVDFHNGEMTKAGCFSNGVAPVRYNDDCALIGKNGKKIRKINKSEFDNLFKSNNSAPTSENSNFSISSLYQKFSENGKYGIKSGNDVIVYPQFDSVNEMYSDGNIMATLAGKQGILNINEGEISVRFKLNDKNTSEIILGRGGKVPPITVECEIPGTLRNLQFLVNDGSGMLTDQTGSFTRSGNILSKTFTPSIEKGATKISPRIVIKNNGLTLADEVQQFTVKQPLRSKVSKPGPEECRAKSDDWAIVSSTIYNDSNKTITVTATWSNGDEKTVQISGQSSARVETRFHVPQKKYTKVVKITLDSGESASREITFIPYF